MILSKEMAKSASKTKTIMKTHSDKRVGVHQDEKGWDWTDCKQQSTVKSYMYGTRPVPHKGQTQLRLRLNLTLNLLASNLCVNTAFSSVLFHIKGVVISWVKICAWIKTAWKNSAVILISTTDWKSSFGLALIITKQLCEFNAET